MSRSVRVASALASAVFVLAAGCAAMGAEGDKEAGLRAPVRIQVENGLPSGLTVSIMTDVGSGRLLGSVTPGDTRTFHYEAGAAGATYRLIASTTSGGRVASRPFNVVEGEWVVWRVETGVGASSLSVRGG